MPNLPHPISVYTPSPRGVLGVGVVLFLFLLLSSCGPQRGRLRITGEYENLPQADLLLFSPDGGLSTIDTLHVVRGKFKYETRLPDANEQYTWVILYPNFSTLRFIAHSGTEVSIKGDAFSLGNERVEGADSVLPVEQHRGKQLLKVGGKLPKNNIVKMQRGRWMLVSFWAEWKHGSSTANYFTRQALQQYPDSLSALTYSLDLAYREQNENSGDTLHWHTYCDHRGWASPLVGKFGIRNLPYFILLNPKGRIEALGTDYTRDIKPTIQRIGSNQSNN